MSEYTPVMSAALAESKQGLTIALADNKRLKAERDTWHKRTVILSDERDRLLAVNKTLAEALEKIAADTERQQLPITTMIHLDAKAALKAGKGE